MHGERRYRRNAILTNVFEFTSRFTPNLMNVQTGSQRTNSSLGDVQCSLGRPRTREAEVHSQQLNSDPMILISQP